METLSDRVFEWMRREFAMRLGVCEGSIHPDTPLSRFLPSERRRAFWRAGQRELGLRFPALELPQSLRLWGHGLALGSATRSLVVGLLFGAKWLAVPLALASWILAAVFYRWLTLPWATERPDLETFGDLSRLLLARNLKTFRRRFGIKPNRDEIFATLTVLLGEISGADPREITPETTFAELLGC